jgi:zinc transporter, ZIP family
LRDAVSTKAGAGLSAPPARRFLPWIILPLAVLAIVAGWLIAADPLRTFDEAPPPLEGLTFERTILDADGLGIRVRGGGSEPVTIAQVQVDDAYWQFTQDPAGPIARGATAWIHLPFPWVEGEAHAVKVVTNTGATFDHEVAGATPDTDRASLIAQAVLGLFVGILPVATGLLFYPALRGIGSNGTNFLLALTVGLLAFLLVDVLDDALAVASEAAAVFRGAAVVIPATTGVLLAAAGSFLLMMAIGRSRGAPAGLTLATYMALAIGLYNLGQGLSVGAAVAAGAAGLGTFVVQSFTLHSIAQGIGIAAPILKERPPPWTFAGLTLLAGGPAVIGLWIGSLALAPQWSVLVLAIGAGAILQVIVELAAQLRRASGGFADFLPAGITGLACGIGFMYATAMLVKI